MYKKDIHQDPGYFDRYINLVPDVSIIDALIEYAASYLKKQQPDLEALGDRVYAPGKWTIKQILQHLIDTERVFLYRAMAFARGEEAVLPPFDEDAYAHMARVDHRNIEEMLEEFDHLRKSGILMYNTFTEEDLQRRGRTATSTISVLGLGYTITGHVIHHMNVIQERYYPLLTNV